MDRSPRLECHTETPDLFVGNVRRDGKYVVADADDIQLPDRCVACNAPTGARRERMSLVHRSALQWLWWYHLGFWNIWRTRPLGQQVDLLVPLCKRHERRRAAGLWLALISCAAGFIATLHALFERAGSAAALCLGATFVCVCFGYRLRRVIRLKRAREGKVWFEVGRRFVESLPVAAHPAPRTSQRTAPPSGPALVTHHAATSFSAYRGPPIRIAGNAWREGDRIVGDPDDLELPDRCVICNAPCAGHRREVFIKYCASAWRRRVGYLLWPFQLGPRIDRIVQLMVPLCEKHNRRAAGAKALVFGSSALMYVAARSSRLEITPFLALGAVLLGWLAHRFHQVVRVRRVNDDKIWLEVGRPFLESIPRARVADVIPHTTRRSAAR